MRSDKVTPWGRAPIEVVWKAGELLYVAVLEYVRATAALLVPPFRTWAPTTVARSAVEASAQALWLLDPKIPGRIRVGRYSTMRLYAARQLEYTHGKVSPGDPLHIYGTPPANVAAEAGALGLKPVTNKNSNAIGYEGEKPKSINTLVQAVVGGNGAYSLLSGSAHSEFWSLLGGYQNQGPSPFGVSVEQQEAEVASFVPLVRACLQALLKPIDHACELFDRRALANDLQRVFTKIVALMGE